MNNFNYIRYCIDTDPISLIPSKCNDYIGKIICSAMYTQLFQKDINEKWVLGDDVEKLDVVNNGLKYIFHIDKKAKWSDGTSISAVNYLETFYNIILDKEETIIGGYLDCILNAEKIKAGESRIQELGVKAIDKYTLEIELEYNVSYLKSLLGSIYLSPTPTHLNKETIYTNKDRVTNGVYYIKEYLKGKYVLLHPNKHKREKSSNELLFLVKNDIDESIKLYERGCIDITCDTYFPFKDIKKYSNKSIFKIIDSSIIFLLIFNYNNKKEIYNKSLRKALLYSIDKNKICQTLYEGITPWNNFVPKYFINYYIDTKNSSFSINKARKYYNDSGNDFNTISMKMIYANFYPNKEIALYIKHSWKTILGINLVLEELSFEEYLSKVKSDEYDICLSLLSPTFRSSICFYMYYLNYISEKSEDMYIQNLENFMEYGDLNGEYQKDLEGILYDELPVIPLFNGKSIYLNRENVSGYKIFSDGTTFFKNMKKGRIDI